MNFPGFNTPLNLQKAVPNLKFPATFKIADLVSIFFEIAVFTAAFMAFYWLIWGAVQYIMAGGKKEDLAKARARITWAIVGLAVVLLSYLIATYAGEVFPSRPGPGASPTPGGVGVF